MKLICHIGTPSTGAGLIQNSLSKNAVWLEERGVIYGDAQAHGAKHETLYVACAQNLPDYAQTYGCKTEQDQKGFRARLSDSIGWEVSQALPHVHTMLLSCEDLTAQSTQGHEIKRLHETLSPHFDDMRIVIYLRRQDDAILAEYAKALRNGTYSDDLDHFVEQCLQPKGSLTPYLYYARMLDRWIDNWGKQAITVRRYSQADFINGDLLDDVVGVIMNTWEPDMNGFDPGDEERDWVSAPALQLLRHINSTIDNVAPDKLNGRYAAQREHLLRHLDRLPTRPKPIMPRDLSRRIMAHFESANSRVKASFAPNLVGSLFPDRPDHPEFGNLEHLSAEDAIAVSSQVLANLMMDDA